MFQISVSLSESVVIVGGNVIEHVVSGAPEVVFSVLCSLYNRFLGGIAHPTAFFFQMSCATLLGFTITSVIYMYINSPEI